MKSLLLVAALALPSFSAFAHPGYRHHRHHHHGVYGFENSTRNDDGYGDYYSYNPNLGANSDCRAPRGARGWYYVPGCH